MHVIKITTLPNIMKYESIHLSVETQFFMSIFSVTLKKNNILIFVKKIIIFFSNVHLPNLDFVYFIILAKCLSYVTLLNYFVNIYKYSRLFRKFSQNVNYEIVKLDTNNLMLGLRVIFCLKSHL